MFDRMGSPCFFVHIRFYACLIFLHTPHKEAKSRVLEQEELLGGGFKGLLFARKDAPTFDEYVFKDKWN